MERLNRHRDDRLSALLRALNVHSTVYCVSDCRAPWGFRIGESPVAKFHLVLEGACHLREVPFAGDLMLEAGDFVVLPHGDGHVVSDSPHSRATRLERILEDHPLDGGILDYGGRGRRTRLVCGGFALDERVAGELRRLLPHLVRLDASTSGLRRFIDPLLSLPHEDSRPGEAAVFEKVAEVFIAETVRSYLAAASETSVESLAPLPDAAVAEAVDLLRDRADEPWTVGRLARAVGLSRTQLSVRFRELVGITPMRYLTKIRLMRAAGQLATTTDGLYTIARAAGYDTEASFSKAFKRAFGQPPGAYRRARAARPIELEADRSLETRRPDVDLGRTPFDN